MLVPTCNLGRFLSPGSIEDRQAAFCEKIRKEVLRLQVTGFRGAVRLPSRKSEVSLHPDFARSCPRGLGSAGLGRHLSSTRPLTPAAADRPISGAPANRFAPLRLARRHPTSFLKVQPSLRRMARLIVAMDTLTPSFGCSGKRARDRARNRSPSIAPRTGASGV